MENRFIFHRDGHTSLVSFYVFIVEGCPTDLRVMSRPFHHRLIGHQNDIIIGKSIRRIE